MVRRLFLGVAACTAIMAAAGDFINAAGLVQQPPSGAITSRVASHRAIFDRYCVTCHNERLKTAGVIFDALNVDDVGPGRRSVGKSRPEAPGRLDAARRSAAAG